MNVKLEEIFCNVLSRKSRWRHFHSRLWLSYGLKITLVKNCKTYIYIYIYSSSWNTSLVILRLSCHWARINIKDITCSVPCVKLVFSKYFWIHLMKDVIPEPVKCSSQIQGDPLFYYVFRRTSKFPGFFQCERRWCVSGVLSKIW